jgi:hypothetical protein
MMASDPIPALMLATPYPDCGAAIGQPCRITNPPPAPPGVDPDNLSDRCAGRLWAALNTRN